MKRRSDDSDSEGNFIIIGMDSNLSRRTGSRSVPKKQEKERLEFDGNQDGLVDVTDEVYCPALLPLLKNTPLFKLEQFTNDSEDEDDAGSELSTVTVSAKSKETDSKDKKKYKNDLDIVVLGKKSENDKLFDDDDTQSPIQHKSKATTTAKPTKTPKRHGLVALFKKNAGMS